MDGKGLDASQDSKASGEVGVVVKSVPIKRIHSDGSKLGVITDTLNSAVLSIDWASCRANKGCAAPTR